jgi:hypothetical protein
MQRICFSFVGEGTEEGGEEAKSMLLTYVWR